MMIFEKRTEIVIETEKPTKCIAFSKPLYLPTNFVVTPTISNYLARLIILLFHRWEEI